MRERQPDLGPQRGGEPSSLPRSVFAKKLPPTPDLERGLGYPGHYRSRDYPGYPRSQEHPSGQLPSTRGYPGVAAIFDQDQDFMLYRRFGHMHARILLHKQDEINRLEEELEGLKGVKGTVEHSWARTRARENEHDVAITCSHQPGLIDVIQQRLYQYSK